jgi:hypothetical protein
MYPWIEICIYIHTSWISNKYQVPIRFDNYKKNYQQLNKYEYKNLNSHKNSFSPQQTYVTRQT